jgi:hypothetical protein
VRGEGTGDFGHVETPVLRARGDDDGAGGERPAVVEVQPARRLRDRAAPRSRVKNSRTTSVHYADIAPINDTTAAANLTITGTSAAETINVVNGPVLSGVQTTQVNSSGDTFELINFAHKTNVTIAGGGGGDTFDLNNLAPAAGLSQLAVDASNAASSTFNVVAMPGSVSVALVGGGFDTANIGSGSAQSISSPLSITDPPSFIAVNVNDSLNAALSRFVTLSASGTSDTISGLAPSTITARASDLASLTLSGGSLGNTFIVSGSSGPVTLNTGTGTDSTFVQNIGAGSSVAIHGQNGNDGVAVSNAGTVQGLLGPVSIDNAAGLSTLVVDDSNDSSARSVSLSQTGATDTISGLAPSGISVKAGDLGAFMLDGGSGGNTIALAGLGLATAASTATLNTGSGADTTTVQPTSNLGPLNINGQTGADTVNLGTPGSLGTVQGLAGAVTVANSGATALNVNDVSDSIARAVTVGTTAISGLAPAQISFAGVPALTIAGGAPSDTFAVTPSQTTTDTIAGGGSGPATLPGNTLSMTLTGTTAPVLTGTPSAAGVQGAWSFANRNPVNFSHMQSLNPTAVSIGDASTTVGGSGSSPLVFPVTLLAPSTQPLNVSYASADGSARSASGAYQPASGTVSFPTGTTSQTISLTALGQPRAHAPQTVTVTLSSPLNAVLTRASATGTIIDSYTPPRVPPVAPVLTHLAQTRSTWRAGSALAVISRASPRRAPIGTRLSFVLNESARVTLAFSRRVPGRVSNGHCLAPTKRTAKHRACVLLVISGSLSLTGHAGTNRIDFQGRLTRTRTLKPGRYTLAVVAINAAGQRSRSSTLTFVIVK